MRIPANVTSDSGSVTEYQFWLTRQTELASIRICDPACGSGAFLVAAFEVLKEAYTQLHLRLRELAPAELLLIDIRHQILNRNLFGVDINTESIEITKLSLWLKTAEKDRKLARLEANFYQGNSLVTDPALDPLAFDWQNRFAAIFHKVNAPDLIAAHTCIRGATGLNDGQSTPLEVDFGGFAVISGSPPYVRQELFSDLKPTCRPTTPLTTAWPICMCTFRS